MDSIPLAKEHLVTIWSTVDPKIKDCSEVIASTGVEKPSAPIIFKMVNLTCQTIRRYKLQSIANVVDAHSSNWSALLHNSTHSAEDTLPNKSEPILPQELRDKYAEIDYSINFIISDPVTDEPIFNCPDPMHLTKNIVFALEKSWSKNHKRNILYKTGKCLMHLGLVKLVWLALGGGTAQLQQTKLSFYHFYKDNNS